MNVVDGLVGRAAAAVDRAVAVAMRGGRRGARAELIGHDERLQRLAQVRDAYGAPATDDYFAAPPPVSPSLRRVRALDRGGEVLDATWRSASLPWLDGVRERYLAHESNHRVHARLFLAPRPRPAVVLIHGYLGGNFAVEEYAWPIDWMIRRGLDVALALLPFHGLRGGRRGGPPPFPGPDPRFTNEGFRQAVSDLRGLIGLLRARGAPQVGVMGMSLGGYTTSLLATVVSDLAFAVPIIPLSSMADFLRDQGRLGTGPRAEAQHRAIEEANWVVSPFARPSRVPSERMMVVGAQADRITGIAQAERLARKFEAPLHRLPGGHLLQIGRGEAFREIRRMWQRLGVI